MGSLASAWREQCRPHTPLQAVQPEPHAKGFLGTLPLARSVLAKKTPKEQKKTALIKQPAWLRHEPSRNTGRSASPHSLHRAAKELKAAGRKAKLASLWKLGEAALHGLVLPHCVRLCGGKQKAMECPPKTEDSGKHGLLSLILHEKRDFSKHTDLLLEQPPLPLGSPKRKMNWQCL